MVAAFVAAACTGPEEAIDSTEAQLELAPASPYDDPDYVADRIMELTRQYAGRLTEEEIEALQSGELTSQEALEMSEEEHAEFAREMRSLFDAVEVLFTPATQGPIGKKENDGRGPPPKTGDKEVRCDDSDYRRCLWARASLGAGLLPVQVWPAVALVTVYDCLCTYCRGGWVDTVCHH